METDYDMRNLNAQNTPSCKLILDARIQMSKKSKFSIP